MSALHRSGQAAFVALLLASSAAAQSPVRWYAGMQGQNILVQIDTRSMRPNAILENVAVSIGYYDQSGRVIAGQTIRDPSIAQLTSGQLVQRKYPSRYRTAVQVKGLALQSSMRAAGMIAAERPIAMSLRLDNGGSFEYQKGWDASDAPLMPVPEERAPDPYARGVQAGDEPQSGNDAPWPPVQAVAGTNEIRGFRILSETDDELLLGVDYRYSGDHGTSAVRIIAVPDEEGGVYNPRLTESVEQELIAGGNSARLRIKMKPEAPSFTSVAIRVCMAQGRTAILCKDYPFRKSWAAAAAEVPAGIPDSAEPPTVDPYAPPPPPPLVRPFPVPVAGPAQCSVSGQVRTAWGDFSYTKRIGILSMTVPLTGLMVTSPGNSSPTRVRLITYGGSRVAAYSLRGLGPGYHRISPPPGWKSSPSAAGFQCTRPGQDERIDFFITAGPDSKGE